MSRIPQQRAVKGSQKWIQKLVNEKPDLLNSPIRSQLDLPDTERILWLSPIADDEYAGLGVKPQLLTLIEKAGSGHHIPQGSEAAHP